MSDPRNVQHDKKVMQEKKHHHEEITPGAVHTPQPGKKMAVKKEEEPAGAEDPTQADGEGVKGE